MNPKELSRRKVLGLLSLGVPGILAGCKSGPERPFIPEPEQSKRPIKRPGRQLRPSPELSPTAMTFTAQERSRLKQSMRVAAEVVDEFLNPAYAAHSVYINQLRHPEALTDNELEPYVREPNQWIGANNLYFRRPILSNVDFWKIRLGPFAIQEFHVNVVFNKNQEIYGVDLGTSYIQQAALEELSGFDFEYGTQIKPQDLAAVARTVYKIPEGAEFEFGINVRTEFTDRNPTSGNARRMYFIMFEHGWSNLAICMSDQCKIGAD